MPRHRHGTHALWSPTVLVSATLAAGLLVGCGPRSASLNEVRQRGTSPLGPGALAPAHQGSREPEGASHAFRWGSHGPTTLPPALPQEIVAALEETTQLSGPGADVLLGDAGEPTPLEPSKRDAIIEETERTLRAVLGPDISLAQAPFEAYAASVPGGHGGGPDRVVPLLRTGALARVTGDDGELRELAVRVTRTSLHVGLVATGPGVEALPSGADIAQALVAWQPGLEGIGAVEESNVAGGTLWSLRDHPGPGFALDRLARYACPRAVSAWSDGTWCWVTVGLICPADGEIAVPLEVPDLLTEPDHPNARAALLQRSTPRPLTPAEWTSTATTAASYTRCAEVVTECPEGPTTALAGDGGTLAPGPVPHALADRIALGSLSACMQADTGTEDGETAGYIEAASVGTGFRCGRGALCEWALADGRLVVTVASPQEALTIPRSSPYIGDEGQVREMLAEELPALMGEGGRRLCAIPAEVSEADEGGWYRVTFPPGNEVGVGERVRVGDTPWGNCRIWTKSGVLRLVFDLDDAE